MPITSFAALMLLATQTATPAPAPAPAPAPSTGPQAAPASPPQGQAAPPPEFVQAAQAFGQCVGQSAGALPATVTPEAGAKQALTGCATQKTALETRFEAWITSPSFPEAGRAPAREQFRTQMASVETQIADGLRQSRAAATPAPTATPTPTPAPAPTPSR